MTRRMWLVLALALLAGALVFGAHALVAQAAPSTPTPNDVDNVAKELWCPLCNGVRLDNCELQACVQMREVISTQLAAGKSKDQIKAYFQQQYGDVVLGMPSSTGFNLVAWGAPIAVGVIALGLLAYVVYLWSRRRTAGAPAGTTGAAPAGGDDYLKRVDEELKRYK